ncbi:MAG: BlaI/MecI/CopY family transcriptional regulator [Candidatus Levybacteria bacterium]|nr:BlaI/MecI/CopY family transcriptional regulator [Candidatus Levybacteria bacterium]
MKSASLGELEQQIMDILWEHKNCSARDVLIILEKDKKLAYTTVATILQRLYDKGLVKRTEDKSGYIYSPKLSKEKYSSNIAQSFLKKFIDSFGDTAIASFAESIDKLPAKRREYFLKLLEEYDKNK